MARCKLTRMSLRNIRKDKQYQCIVIDFVRTGVISKSKAEELLNYTIPAGLLENSAYVPDDDESGTGGETGGETGSETSGSATLAINLIPMADTLGISISSIDISNVDGVDSDGWLLVNFPLPEDPKDRWLRRESGKENVYNTDLLDAMRDTIKTAVINTGLFDASNFDTYVDNADDVPVFAVVNENYQTGDLPLVRFQRTSDADTLTDDMIISYTSLANISGGGLSGDPTVNPPENPNGEGQTPFPPVTTRTVAVKAYGMYQPSCGGPQLNHFHDEHYYDVNSLDIEISSDDSINDVKDKILTAYTTKCGVTGVDSSGNHTAGSLVAHPATEVIFITDVSYSTVWTEMNPQPSDISAFDGMDTIEVILR